MSRLIRRLEFDLNVAMRDLRSAERELVEWPNNEPLRQILEYHWENVSEIREKLYEAMAEDEDDEGELCDLGVNGSGVISCSKLDVRQGDDGDLYVDSSKRVRREMEIQRPERDKRGKFIKRDKSDR